MHPTRTAFAAAALLALGGGATLGLAAPETMAPVAGAVLRGDPNPGTAARLSTGAFGRSGKLRVLVADRTEELRLPLLWEGGQTPAGDVWYSWEPVAGTRPEALLGGARLDVGLRAPSSPGIWRLRLRATDLNQPLEELSVITRVPFADKRGGFLNGYRIGTYATEGSAREDMYAPPPGFIEVTPENQDLKVSEHFALRNFLTKDQFSVWPKYLALDLRLIDKLELVLQELNAMGVRAERMAVMSGYRTPAYNGPGEGGRARLSRHTYGDASDVWVDNDGDGWMDDLNGDGRRDTRDGEVLARAVDRVEARYPELIGGVGVYTSSSAHGPFVHIDARGVRARW
jgi:uncharacterized protein YcbK (DUF882 family)